MDKRKLDRINELAKKAKEGALTEEELTERALLRKEYIDEFKKNLRSTLDNTVIVEKDGTRTPLKDKKASGIQN